MLRDNLFFCAKTYKKPLDFFPLLSYDKKKSR